MLKKLDKYLSMWDNKYNKQTERYIVKTKIYTVENIGYFYYNIEATSEKEAIDKLQGSILDHDQFEMDSQPTVVEVCDA